MVKLAPEGYPYIAGAAAITVIVIAIGGLWIAFFPFILTFFMLFFFRDPERKIPGNGGIFVSPADGKIILIKDESNNLISPSAKKVDGEFVGISIFMSPLDVHVNRAPCDGTVESVIYNPGKFLSAFKHEASLQNESISMILDTKYGKIMIRQVAGLIARRAVCRVKVGDSLNRGERYGIIKFSSRLDVFLPKEIDIKVKLGDRVKAGETIIGIVSR
ncbi:MAG: phosphatidylserine decarboxylase family protein [Nitrospirae bacterium]|nr:phosphatidylserine decarboxylase family protein [Nitrospirota bacterium]